MKDTKDKKEVNLTNNSLRGYRTTTPKKKPETDDKGIFVTSSKKGKI